MAFLQSSLFLWIFKKSAENRNLNTYTQNINVYIKSKIFWQCECICHIRFNYLQAAYILKYARIGQIFRILGPNRKYHPGRHFWKKSGYSNHSIILRNLYGRVFIYFSKMAETSKNYCNLFMHSDFNLASHWKI